MYFISSLPYTIILFILARAPILMLGFILQILLVSPVLIVLSHKIWRYHELSKTNVVRWSGVSAIIYIAGILILNMSNWISMISSVGVGFIQSGINLLGFLNLII